MWLLMGLVLGAGGEAWARSHPVLDQLTGRWVGTFWVRSLDGATLQTLRVEQQYWWQGEEQHGIGVYDRQGELTWVTSRTFRRGEAWLCEVRYADAEPKLYAARFQEGSVTWLPTDVLEATRRQMRESAVTEGGRRLLRTSGFDHVGPPDQRVAVRIEGELEWAPAP